MFFSKTKSKCPESFGQNCRPKKSNKPFTFLSFSSASSTTRSEERLSPVLMYSEDSEFHWQLLGRHRGIALLSAVPGIPINSKFGSEAPRLILLSYCVSLLRDTANSNYFANTCGLYSVILEDKKGVRTQGVIDHGYYLDLFVFLFFCLFV